MSISLSFYSNTSLTPLLLNLLPFSSFCSPLSIFFLTLSLSHFSSLSITLSLLICVVPEPAERVTGQHTQLRTSFSLFFYLQYTMKRNNSIDIMYFITLTFLNIIINIQLFLFVKILLNLIKRNQIILIFV